MGLAGLYIIDDPADPSSLPSGEFDVPLAIADRQFDENNQLLYVFDPDGVTGDKVLINGVFEPYWDVASRKYRLRFLNASNARIYNLSLSTGDSFVQVGTESGLLPAPVTRSEMTIGPGERLDVVVDFTGRLGQELYLVDSAQKVPLLKFRVTQAAADSSTSPSTLRPLPDIGEPTLTRQFSFDHTSGHWTINGLRFDPDRVDAHPVLGTTEKWVFTNPTGSTHMVHVHDVDQQCVSRNGGPCHPYEAMKETWSVGPGETLEVKLKFTDHLGMYMLHCHILEHEDDGMMTHFHVMEPLTPTNIVSRKTHGSAGTFDIPMPLHGELRGSKSEAPTHGMPGIESRSGGANNEHQIVVTFGKPVTFSNATVAGGTASIGSATASGSEVTLNLTGVANAQTVRVTLAGVSDGVVTSDISLPLGFLLGDVNGNATVNTTDIGQTKSISGQAVTATNFRADVNASGSVNATDIGLVKSRAGTVLPAQ
jgi:hypothetical protein